MCGSCNKPSHANRLASLSRTPRDQNNLHADHKTLCFRAAGAQTPPERRADLPGRYAALDPEGAQAAKRPCAVIGALLPSTATCSEVRRGRSQSSHQQGYRSRCKDTVARKLRNICARSPSKWPPRKPPTRLPHRSPPRLLVHLRLLSLEGFLGHACRSNCLSW